jgi:hypothetical protein
MNIHQRQPRNHEPRQGRQKEIAIRRPYRGSVIGPSDSAPIESPTPLGSRVRGEGMPSRLARHCKASIAERTQAKSVVNLAPSPPAPLPRGEGGKELSRPMQKGARR